jgi:putative transposase
VNLAQRNGNDLLVKHVDALRDAFRIVKMAHPFELEAIVILPDHLHAIWRVPPNDSDFSRRWRLIKAYFSKMIPHEETISPSRSRKGERGIWQRRYWEHVIRDDLDMQRHLDYIHYNPVKHGYANSAIDWPFSSFHRYLADGYYFNDWFASDDALRSAEGDD